MSPDQVQTLPEAPVGVAPEAPSYTAEQLAEMQSIPSRPCLDDKFVGLPRYTEFNPCPSHDKRCRRRENPYYNARMDPGSDSWDAHGYFARQEQETVYVHIDPESPETQIFGMSINGFELPCFPGRRQKMPKDFAELLRNRNNRLDVNERRLVSKDPDAEGALSLTVGGAMAKPFERRIAD